MEETILQRILAEEFLQTDLEIDDDAKQAVAEARELLEEDDFEALGDRIDALRSKVEDQKRRVSNEIHEIRIGMQSRVNGMRRLNERVERVSEVRLEAVHESSPIGIGKGRSTETMSGALKDSSSGLQTTGRTCGSISKSAAKRYSARTLGRR